MIRETSPVSDQAQVFVSYCSGDYKELTEDDPRGPAEALPRVILGGRRSCVPVYCRSAHRSRNEPADRSTRPGLPPGPG